MKRYYVLMVVIVLVLSIIGAVAARSQEKKESVFLEAFAVAGAEPERIEIRYWVRLDDFPATPEQAKEKASMVASRIGITCDMAALNKVVHSGGNIVEIRGRLPSGEDAEISLQRLEEEELAYLFVRIEGEGEVFPDSIVDKGTRLMMILSDLGSDGSVSVSLGGKIADRLSPEEMAARARKIVQGLEGEVVEGIESESLVSLTAYSPLIHTYLLSGQHPVNLNIALRYDSYKGATRIWMGIPLIEGAY